MGSAQEARGAWHSGIMGNQAGKQKGEAGDYDPAAAGGDGKGKKGGKWGDSRTNSFGDGRSTGPAASSHPIDFGAEHVGSAAGEHHGGLKSMSPGSGAMPVPSPKNIPIGVPMAAGKVVPYKRPKGTIEWDSEEEEEEDDAAARRDSKSKSKVSLTDFEVLHCIHSGHGRPYTRTNRHTHVV